jgi:hypothetical protein
VDLNFFGSVAPLPAIGEWVAMVLAAGAGVGWATRRVNDTGRKLLLSATTLMVVVLLGEGGLRLLAAVVPQSQDFPTYTSANWSRRYVELNDLGFRDVNHTHSIPTGARRLLVVGDSFAFGTGINAVGNRLGEQLAGRLSERLGEPWHSMNAAIPDSDTLDEIEYLERTRLFKRDAVLLVYVFNDIDYLSTVTSRTILTEHQSGFFGRIHPARVLFLNSYLFQEIFVRARIASYALSDEPGLSNSPYAHDAILDRHLDDLTRFVEFASMDDIPLWIAPFDIAPGKHAAARYARFQE